MRIAFIGLKGIPGNFTGVETYVEEIGARLSLRHEVWAYCRPHYVPKTGEIEFRGINRVWLPSIKTKHLDATFHSLVSSLHSTFRGFDIYHFQALGPSAFSVFPRLKGAKIVVTVHGLDWARAKWGRVAKRFLKAAEKVMINVADAIIVVSRSLERYYLNNYGLKTFYIPNGVCASNFITKEKLSALSLEPNSYLLFMARLTPEKGAHILIDAFREIDADKKLVIAGSYQAGEKWYYEYLKTLAGDDKRIIFAGWVEGELKSALLQYAFAFIQPSTLEGLSIGLLEAASSGVLCVASDIPENREVLEVGDKRYGIFFKSQDVEDLKSKLESLLGMSASERERMAFEAKQHVLSEFNWDKAAQKTEEVYEGLLNR